MNDRARISGESAQLKLRISSMADGIVRLCQIVRQRQMESEGE